MLKARFEIDIRAPSQCCTGQQFPEARDRQVEIARRVSERERDIDRKGSHQQPNYQSPIAAFSLGPKPRVH